MCDASFLYLKSVITESILLAVAQLLQNVGEDIDLCVCII